MDLLTALATECERAEGAVESEDVARCRTILRESARGLRFLTDLVTLAEMADGEVREAARAGLGVLGDVVEKHALPDPFDRGKGDDLVSAINLSRKALGLADEQVDPVFKRWTEAVAKLPKSVSASTGASRPRGSNAHRSFKIRCQTPKGDVKYHHPADIALSTQINQARHWLGVKGEHPSKGALTDALRRMLGDDGSVEERVDGVGTLTRQDLAG